MVGTFGQQGRALLSRHAQGTEIARTNISQSKLDRRHHVGSSSCDHIGDHVSDRVARLRWHVYRLNACLEIEFLDPQVRASAHACGAKLQLTGLRLCRCYKLANSR